MFSKPLAWPLGKEKLRKKKFNDTNAFLSVHFSLGFQCVIVLYPLDRSPAIPHNIIIIRHNKICFYGFQEHP